MPMSDGKTELRKIMFQIGNKFFRFAINPESYTHAKPHRTTAVKTKSRIVIEDFQSDIPTITIKGSTGFNPTGKSEDRGITKIKELKAYLEWYAEMGGNGRTASEDFYFHNFTNDESYVVHLSPEGVNFVQDVSSPLTYNYDIKFVILRKASEPADADIMNPQIGNRFPSITYNPPTAAVPNTEAPIMVPGIHYFPGITSPGLMPPGTGGNFTTNPPAPGDDSVYGDGSVTPYNPTDNDEPINPQAPSPAAYYHGTNGLGFAIGYYGRSYTP